MNEAGWNLSCFQNEKKKVQAIIFKLSVTLKANISINGSAMSSTQFILNTNSLNSH